MRGFEDAPEAHVLPASDAELVEERNGVAAFDGGEQGAIAGAEMLVAVSTFARVVDGIGRVGRAVWIAWVDTPEVCQQRDESPAALIDAVSYAMRSMNFSPGENLFGERLRRIDR